ncbi:hypothetical protein CTI12_AA100440 [Artemisia annua]|uniref:Histone deacetylase domain-containing protein n=1 Tax=Artemisia annua TaxID=35608 RepID=A0A2U1PXK8_ARTAN|nr:hypothetical protein CTI12_AA100440 [Artemisia annua]
MEAFSRSSLPTPGTDVKKCQVTYFYEPTIGDYTYGPDHFMVPRRITMTHSMIERYKLEQHMNIVKILPAETVQMYMFHSKGYIDFLSEVSPSNIRKKDTEIVKHYIEKLDDCLLFDVLFQFCKLSAGEHMVVLLDCIELISFNHIVCHSDTTRYHEVIWSVSVLAYHWFVEVSDLTFFGICTGLGVKIRRMVPSPGGALVAAIVLNRDGLGACITPRRPKLRVCAM